MPAGKFLRNVKFLRRSECAPKVINSEVTTGAFCTDKVWNPNLDLKLWERGRVFQDLKRQISLCTTHFSSETKKWKTDGHCYNFKNPPFHPWINSLLRLDTNSLLCCFHYFYPWSPFLIYVFHMGICLFWFHLFTLISEDCWLGLLEEGL